MEHTKVVLLASDAGAGADAPPAARRHRPPQAASSPLPLEGQTFHAFGLGGGPYGRGGQAWPRRTFKLDVTPVSFCINLNVFPMKFHTLSWLRGRATIACIACREVRSGGPFLQQLGLTRPTLKKARLIETVFGTSSVPVARAMTEIPVPLVPRSWKT